MPFGVRNGAQTFQRFMNSILHDLDFVSVYVDDLLVRSKTYKGHLDTVFSCLGHGININPEKCMFSVEKLDFLGCQVS